MKIIFLSLADAVELHREQINFYGGTPGIRDVGLLRSALNAPCATHDGVFLHTTMYEMAAAYLFHIIRNHPFIDGNKRTGLICALTFLSLHNCAFNAPPKALLELVPSVAEGTASKAEIAMFIKKWSSKIDGKPL